MTIDSFVEWLEKEMKSRGMTQADVAKGGDISSATLSRIIGKTRKVGPDTAKKIARAREIGRERIAADETGKRLAEIDAELARLNSKIDGLLERFGDDDTLADNVTRKIDEIKVRVSALSTERESLTGTATDAEYQRIALDALEAQLVKIRRLLKSPTTEVKRKIIEAVETRVTVLTDEMGRRLADVETLLGDSRLPLLKPQTGRPRNG